MTEKEILLDDLYTDIRNAMEIDKYRKHLKQKEVKEVLREIIKYDMFLWTK